MPAYKRVSRINATDGNTTRTSARTTNKVDAGFVSFKKTHRTPITRTRSVARCGFFAAGAWRAGVSESVPACLARRRLAAGPIPAASLRTGQF
jgi:hypothetical protein